MSSPHSLPEARERFVRGWFVENPTYVQMLGMCPTLAVTNTLSAAVTMAVATGVVLLCSNIITSLIRRQLQPHLRILVYTLTIATFVTIVDRLLAAFAPAMSRQLGPYVPLIIVNCIIISRAEVCASRQSVRTAIADALGQGGGFLLGLSSLGIVRELLGSGSVWGLKVLPDKFPLMLIFVLPAGAFLTLGIFSGILNAIRTRERGPS
ncbi:MAG TPA: electron transport complex subunit RsxE [Planctomycetaceae bacterium]|nr:electron transport complex subunit RsxE [Planctomycetaceae bacterium]